MKQNRSRGLVGIVLIFIIIVGDIIAGAVSIHAPSHPISHDGTQLGTWYNYPTSCPSQDSCELFYNITRQSWTPGNNTITTVSGYSAFLVVDCLFGSVSPGAYLQLQYALYMNGDPSTVLPPTNATNWQNLGTVYIGNVQNNEIPNCGLGNVPATSADQSLNATSGCTGGVGVTCGYVFRVLGLGGSVANDNPRFRFIGVGIEANFRRTFTAFVSATTTTLSYALYSSIPFASSTSVSFKWFATNVTTTACGLLATATKHCWENGSSSCSFSAGQSSCPTSSTNSITFGTAFTNTVRGDISWASIPANVPLILTTLTLFTTEAVTV